MTNDNDMLVARAAQAGIDNFLATHGLVPDRFKVLHQHAPGAFAGYGLMRHALMQDRPTAALDLKTKELIFVALCALAGDKGGALNHALTAMKIGAAVAEIAEALVQAITMVGGITTWNSLVGYDVLKTCADQANGAPPLSPV